MVPTKELTKWQGSRHCNVIMNPPIKECTKYCVSSREEVTGKLEKGLMEETLTFELGP